jgi:acetolactate synthase-1/3 small subunit
MTIVIESQDEKILEQIKKQLNKLINVITVTDFTKKEHVGRELILANVKYSRKDKPVLEAIFNKYIGKIVYHKDGTAIIEAVGDRIQIKNLLDELDKLGIRELARTGQLAISKKM